MEHKFQINLRGLIDLLSNHLYSGPEVFGRELLQNGVDAIRARTHLEPGFQGEVTVEVHHRPGKPPALVFADNGIGQMLEWGRQMFRLDIVLGGVVITGLIGFSLDKLCRIAERRLVRWQYR